MKCKKQKYVRKRYVLYLLGVILSSCAVQNQTDWYSGVELKQFYGKEKTKEIKEACRDQELSRYNMKRDCFEYNLIEVDL